MKTCNRLTFIGMPAVGKSSIGKTLARAINCAFIDIDKEHAKHTHLSIQAFISQHSEESFLESEAQLVLDYDFPESCIISTGGSMVYSETAMKRLKDISTVIYLEDSFERIEARLSNLETRGIVGIKDRDLKSLFDERCPLYEAYQDITINLSSFSQVDDIVGHIVSLIKEAP